MSRKVKKPVSVKQSVSVGNVNQNNNYQNEDFPEQKMIGMANPASVYCVEQGGESIIKQNKDGSEYGICKFKDGKEVDEWEFYRKIMIWRKREFLKLIKNSKGVEGVEGNCLKAVAF